MSDLVLVAMIALPYVLLLIGCRLINRRAEQQEQRLFLWRADKAMRTTGAKW